MIRLKKLTNITLLILPIIVMILFSLFDRLYYVQSDDYEMNLIAVGAISGKFDSHIVFIKSVFGIIVKILANIYQGCNWFGILYLLIILIYTYVLLFTLRKRTSLVFAVVFALIIEMISFFWITFTFIGYMCIGIAMLKLADAMYHKEVSIKDYVQITLLVIFSYVMRSDTTWTGFMLSMPLLICCFNKKIIKHSIRLVLVVLVCIISINVIEHFEYNSNMWKEYKDYNTYRSKLLDYPIADYENNKEYYDRNRIDEVEINAARGWVFADKSVFSKEMIEEVIDNTPIGIRYNLNIINVIATLLHLKELVASFVIIIIMFGLIKNNRKYLALQIIAMAGLIGIMVVMQRVFKRVYLPIIILGIVFAIYMFLISEKRNIRYSKYCVYGITLVVSFIFLGSYYNMNTFYKNNYKNREVKYEEEREYINNNRDKFYVTFKKFNLMQYENLLGVNKVNGFYNLGDVGEWTIYNKTYYEQAEYYKFVHKERVLLDLIANDNMYYIDSKNSEEDNTFDVVCKYLDKHYGDKYEIVLIKEFVDTGDRILKLKIKN